MLLVDLGFDLASSSNLRFLLLSIHFLHCCCSSLIQLLLDVEAGPGSAVLGTAE